MEARLKEDIIAEAKVWNGNIVTHDEYQGQVNALWYDRT